MAANLTKSKKLKELYGMREKQFKRFFATAERSKEATGDMLLSLLERRLDNVIYRLKMATTRPQAASNYCAWTYCCERS